MKCKCCGYCVLRLTDLFICLQRDFMQMLKEAEAAEKLSLSTDFLRHDRISKQLIPFVRIGRAVRYEEGALNKFIASNQYGAKCVNESIQSIDGGNILDILWPDETPERQKVLQHELIKNSFIAQDKAIVDYILKDASFSSESEYEDLKLFTRKAVMIINRVGGESPFEEGFTQMIKEACAKYNSCDSSSMSALGSVVDTEMAVF